MTNRREKSRNIVKCMSNIAIQVLATHVDRLDVCMFASVCVMRALRLLGVSAKVVPCAVVVDGPTPSDCILLAVSISQQVELFGHVPCTYDRTHNPNAPIHAVVLTEAGIMVDVTLGQVRTIGPSWTRSVPAVVATDMAYGSNVRLRKAWPCVGERDWSASYMESGCYDEAAKAIADQESMVGSNGDLVCDLVAVTRAMVACKGDMDAFARMVSMDPSSIALATRRLRAWGEL